MPTIAERSVLRARDCVWLGENCPSDECDQYEQPCDPDDHMKHALNALKALSLRMACEVQIEDRVASVWEYKDGSIAALADDGIDAVRVWVVDATEGLALARSALDVGPHEHNHECRFVWDPGDPSVGIWPGYICIHSPECKPTAEEVRQFDEEARRLDQALREFRIDHSLCCGQDNGGRI